MTPLPFLLMLSPRKARFVPATEKAFGLYGLRLLEGSDTQEAQVPPLIPPETSQVASPIFHIPSC